MENPISNLKAPYLAKWPNGEDYVIINPRTNLILFSSSNRDEAIDALVGLINQWIDNGHEHASYIV